MNNSSIVPLAVNQNFIGTVTSCIGYNSVCLSIYSDVGDSIAGGIQIQFSDTNVANSYTSSSTTTGSPVNNKLTTNNSDADSIINSYIIITSGPFISQYGNIASKSGHIVTFPIMWNPISLPYTTLTSIIVSASGTTITITGTGLNTTYITAGTSIQLLISSVFQNYLVVSVGTNTSTSIVLTTTGNATVGSSSSISLISPGTGFTYNTGNWNIGYFDTYFNPSKYTIVQNLIKKYYRIVYINGSTAQNSFDLSSYLSPNVSSNIEVSLPNNMLDLYGNLEVVEPQSLLELRFPPFITTQDVTTNTIYSTSGSITATIANSVCTITAVAGTPGNLISQSKQYALYQAGKMMLIYMTGVIAPSANTNGTTTDIGYFDNVLSGSIGGNGLYFSYNPVIGMSVNMLDSRSAILTTIPQYLWNEDRLDGTGKSGIRLNFAKMQIFTIRFVWLGAGMIQFGITCMGKFLICHTITNYNSLTYPWISSPNLPVRYRLTTATSSDSGTLIQGCASIISSGGHSPQGHIYSCSNGQNVITVGVTETPMLAITGTCNTTIGTISGTSSTTNTYYHNIINPVSYTTVATAATVTILISIRLYPAGTAFMGTYPTTGITWTDVKTNGSLIKYAQGGTGTGEIQGAGSAGFTTANSILLHQDYIFSRSQSTSISDLTNSYSSLGSNIQNVCDIIIITGMLIAGNGTSTALCSLTWEEIY